MIACLIVTGLVASSRQLKFLERFELMAYDRFVQIRAASEEADQIMVVGVSEADLQKLGGKLQLSDQVYAQLFQALLKHQPRVIGLDVYRDSPIEPGHEAFNRQLRSSDRIIGITRLGDEVNPPIAGPAALPEDQIGFNDATLDFDGVLRRAVLYQEDPPHSGIFFTAFSFRLAERYLLDEGIESKPSDLNPDYLQLGQATFLPLQPSDGSYVGANMGGYQVLLNYRGRESVIPQFTLDQVLNDQVPAEKIRDRVILIGTTAFSGNDFTYTPYSSDPGKEQGQRMAGVMAHAHMVSQFIDAALGQRELFWFWGEIQEMLWIAAWSFLGGLLAWYIRNPVILILSATSLLGLLFCSCFLLFINMGWVPLIPSAIAFLFASGSVVAYTAQQAQQQQRMVMRLLGQSASPQIAEALWARRDELLENGKLSGQRLTSTLLFTDLKGFSSISEKYTPEELFAWLNEYFEEMTAAIQNHQGVINKFTGDGLMAVFGVPIPHESEAEIRHDAQQAVTCALDMGNRLEQLNQKWIAVGRPGLKMRVGIFTGPVVVGSLGSKIRLEYGVIGDSVNTASRLESLDKNRQDNHCRILIARQTLDYLDDQYQVESWGMLPLKGKEERIEVFQVKGLMAKDCDFPDASVSANLEINPKN